MGKFSSYSEKANPDGSEHLLGAEGTTNSIKILISSLPVSTKQQTEIDTKAGEFRVHKVVPIMPENSIFDGEDSIVGYFSDDKNKIPVRIEAQMFVGKAAVELTGFHGLKNEPALIDTE